MTVATSESYDEAELKSLAQPIHRKVPNQHELLLTALTLSLSPQSPELWTGTHLIYPYILGTQETAYLKSAEFREDGREINKYISFRSKVLLDGFRDSPESS